MCLESKISFAIRPKAQLSVRSIALIGAPLLRDWKADSVRRSIVYAPNRHLSTRACVFAGWMAEL
jgi:hypothetical protein